MKRRASRTVSSTAQLGLWDELDALPRPLPVSAPQAPKRAEHTAPAAVAPRLAEAARRAE
jgi:hypothetical protein